MCSKWHKTKLSRSCSKELSRKTEKHHINCLVSIQDSLKQASGSVHPGKVSTDAANMITSAILFNDVISTPRAKVIGVDLKKLLFEHTTQLS